MVGAAQYLDEEIDWVLSAVVGKKKQSYIQTHFKDKFGRSLNHNQIRYIKNKYGKDPRFNSPLVNTRAPRIATSPRPEVSGERQDDDGRGDELDFENSSEAGLRAKAEQPQDDQRDESAMATRTKRKRGPEGSVDGRYSRLVKKIIGPQRSEFQRDRSSSMAVGNDEMSPHRGNTLDLRFPTTHVRSVSTPAASLTDGHHDALPGGAHGGDIQQFLDTSGSVGWTPSVSLSAWRAEDSPVLTSVGSNVTASGLIQSSTSTGQLYHHPAEQSHVLLQTPVAAQYQLQLPQTLQATSSSSRFSPLTPSVAPSPYQDYQEQQDYQKSQRERQQRQQQHRLHPNVEAPETRVFPSLAISEAEEHPHIHQDILSNVAFPLAPSFQEMPIEPASPHSVTERPALAAGHVHEHH